VALFLHNTVLGFNLDDSHSFSGSFWTTIPLKRLSYGGTSSWLHPNATLPLAIRFKTNPAPPYTPVIS
jgi:hypothetical protein